MLTLPSRSYQLQVLMSLKYRGHLSQDDEIALHNAQQGYQGERAFAKVLQKTLRKEYIVLYGILLEQGGSHFQIDCLVICEAQLYPIEIKHFHGDYYFQDNDLYAVKSRKRMKNPFYQNQRSEDLLHDFLLKHELSYNIHSYVVFNHPSFTLYHAPIQSNMILPTQIHRFIKKLNRQAVRTTEKEKLLVKTIFQEHIEHNPFEKLPVYHYENLKKSIFCLKCYGQMQWTGKYNLECKLCSQLELLNSSVLRSVLEFNLLFPNVKITTSKIHEWCGEIVSLRAVRRVLGKYLVRKGTGKATCYEFLTR